MFSIRSSNPLNGLEISTHAFAQRLCEKRAIYLFKIHRLKIIYCLFPFVLILPLRVPSRAQINNNLINVPRSRSNIRASNSVCSAYVKCIIANAETRWYKRYDDKNIPETNLNLHDSVCTVRTELCIVHLDIIRKVFKTTRRSLNKTLINTSINRLKRYTRIINDNKFSLKCISLNSV